MKPCYNLIMIYVALLRGINVGGKAKVEMATLKKMVENLGCSHVQTYINSGNVIFEDNRSSEVLSKLFEQAMTSSFGHSPMIIVCNLPTIQALCQAIPQNWTNNANQKTDVMFLHPSVDRPEALDAIRHDPKLERVLYVHGAIVWNIARSDVTRGGGVKLIKTDLYKRMTVRNINTTRKLLELMQNCGSN